MGPSPSPSSRRRNQAPSRTIRPRPSETRLAHGLRGQDLADALAAQAQHVGQVLLTELDAGAAFDALAEAAREIDERLLDARLDAEEGGVLDALGELACGLGRGVGERLAKGRVSLHQGLEVAALEGRELAVGEGDDARVSGGAGRDADRADQLAGADQAEGDLPTVRAVRVELQLSGDEAKDRVARLILLEEDLALAHRRATDPAHAVLEDSPEERTLDEGSEGAVWKGVSMNDLGCLFSTVCGFRPDGKR